MGCRLRRSRRLSARTGASRADPGGAAGAKCCCETLRRAALHAGTIRRSLRGDIIIGSATLVRGVDRLFVRPMSTSTPVDEQASMPAQVARERMWLALTTPLLPSGWTWGASAACGLPYRPAGQDRQAPRDARPAWSSAI